MTPFPGQSRRAEVVMLLGVVVAAMLLLLARQLHKDYYRQHPIHPKWTEDQGEFLGPYEFTSHILKIVPYYDTTGQRRAHQVVLVGSAGLAILLWLVAGRLVPKVADIISANPLLLWGLRSITYGGSCWAIWHFWSQMPGMMSWLIGAACVRWFTIDARRFSQGRLNRWIGLLLLLIFLAAMLPAAWMRVDQSAQPRLVVVIIEAHFNLVLSQGDRLAAGKSLFDDVMPGYGLTIPLVTAGLQKCGISLSLLDYIKGTALLQALFVLAAALGYYRYAGRRWILTAVPLLALIVAYHFYNISVRFSAPNHSAVRMFLLPVTLWWLGRWQPRSLVSLGVGTGIMAGANVVYCWDIGIATSIGLIAYTVLRWQRPTTTSIPRHFFTMLASFAAGFTSALLIASLALLAISGKLPGIEALRHFAFIFKMASASGYGGLCQPHVQPLAILIAGHAVVAALSVWAQRGRGPVSPHVALRGTVAVIILVWFGYYTNRFDPVYLQSFLVLYGYLLVDAGRLLIAARRSGWVLPALPVCVAMACIFCPYLIENLRLEWQEYQKGRKVLSNPPAPDSVDYFQGMYLKKGTLAGLEPRAGVLIERAKRGPVYYITVDSYLLPKMTGVWSAVSAGEFVWEAITRRHTERVFQRIEVDRPAEILIDTDGSTSEGGFVLEASRMYLEFARRRLANTYRKDREESGWEVWVRK